MLLSRVLLSYASTSFLSIAFYYIIKHYNIESCVFVVVVLLHCWKSVVKADLGVVLWFVVGCDASCPLDKFVELTERNIPSDWFAECKTDAAANSQYCWLSLLSTVLLIPVRGVDFPPNLIESHSTSLVLILFAPPPSGKKNPSRESVSSQGAELWPPVNFTEVF